MYGMSFFKLIIICIILEERSHTAYFKFHLNSGSKLFIQFLKVGYGFEFTAHCSADGSKQMGMARCDDLFFGKI